MGKKKSVCVDLFERTSANLHEGTEQIGHTQVEGLGKVRGKREAPLIKII